MLTDDQLAVLTARLRRGRASVATGRIERRPADLAILPASSGQEQMWFLEQLAPGRAAYNIPCVVELRGPLDVAALSRAVDALLRRHEALRTRLVAGPDGRPVQEIDRPARDVLRQLDYRTGPDDRAGGVPAARVRLRALAAAELVRPFDLARGPLLRAWLVALGPEEHMLLVTVHHAVFDGWSAGLLLTDLAALYRAEVTGEPSGLAELPVQFADVAVWERGRLSGAVLTELQDYWRGALDGVATLAMPTDRPRPSVSSFDGAEETRAVPVALLAGLRELSLRHGCTLFVTLMAAMQALAHRYTGQTDVVISTAGANRGRVALTPLIGNLVNTLPIRCDLSGDPSFAELLARTQAVSVAATAHQDLPFAQIVDLLGVQREASRLPIAAHMFNLVEHAAGVSSAGVDFSMAGRLATADTAKFDISLYAAVADDEFTLGAAYATELYDAATIAALLGHFEVLLRGAVADPAARLSALPVLTARDLHRELTEWNDTAAAFPVSCLHEGFEARVAADPDAVAAECAGDRWSYRELNQRANQVARRLRGEGVRPEVLVGVCMAPGLARLAGVLGILKAGGAYLPIDPALPADRKSFLVTDAGLGVLLADDAVAGLPDGPAVISLDAQCAAVRELDGGNLPGTGVTTANVAYVIYTSGSTGQPKGVLVEHRQAVNLAHATIRNVGLTAADRVLQFASLSFDVSVKDIFTALLAGGRAVIVPAETRLSPRALAALIRQAGVTFASLTPALLSLLVAQELPSLRAVVAGGEELPAELARAWQRPGLALYNGYGPTEATVTSTFTIVTGADVAAPPPIGRPIANYQAYVLDEQLNPVPAGVIGELHIGGAGVARGYLNRPELTPARFIASPFPGGGRLYKTGDLVKRRADGMIVFVGRADGQVKIRGLRMELGEIETALGNCPGVAQAVLTVVTDPAGDQQLAGYVRAEPGCQVDPARLREQLARTLPGYMVPGYLLEVAQFRLNASGKVDRSALPAPELVPGPGSGVAAADGGFAAPETATEAMLTRLYATVLHRDLVSVTDSFFDIGGSSLAVMRLVDLIGRETGVDVGVTTVFLHPAPRQLAASLDAIASGAAAAPVSGPLVDLGGAADGVPLFLIHAVGGTVFAYAQLAGELAGEFRVRGVQAPGLETPEATAASLAGLVSDYTALIRAAQPSGSYRLAGWSMGGVIAFEVARALEQAGEQVSLLVLLDAPFAMPDAGPPTSAALAGRFLADAVHSLGWDLAGAPDPATASADEQLDWLAGRLDDGRLGDVQSGYGQPGEGQPGAEQLDDVQLGDVQSGGAVDEGLRNRFEVFGAHARMLAGYRPAGPAIQAPTLIVSADASPNAPARARWPRLLAGPVSTMEVSADHYSFLRPPRSADVSTAILKWHHNNPPAT